MLLNPLKTQIIIIEVISLLLAVSVFLVKIFEETIDPIPWLTLIIGGSFGLTITVIANNRSQHVLTFIKNAEQERQLTANRSINNHAKEIAKLTKYYFEIINGRLLDTKEKKDLLNTFLPRLKTLTAFSQNLTPTLGNFILKKDLEKVEEYLKLLNDLLLILEYGSDTKFENNICKLSEYSNKFVIALGKISN